jgi:ABC-2 type transport system permease protein
MILPWAADYEIKNLDLAVVDLDHSDYSRALVNKITSSRYFNLRYYGSSYKNALQEIEQDRADIILQIPASFETDLVKENEASLAVSANAINGVKAGLGSAYLQTIISEFNNNVRQKWIQLPKFNPELMISAEPNNWYNPLMNYKVFMVPGLLVLLLTMVGANLTAINIVKEKETGTIEQINVTPVRKFYFILGKLIPFWILGLVIFSMGLLIAKFIYHITPVGHLLTIYAFASVYLLAVLGLGLLISTYAHTQQQAMLLSFFLLMIFVLMGGLYTSIDSMPEWARWLTRFNPISYFIEVIRMVMLKGSSLYDIRFQFLAITVFALVFNSWAILNYRKRN